MVNVEREKYIYISYVIRVDTSHSPYGATGEGLLCRGHCHV